MENKVMRFDRKHLVAVGGCILAVILIILVVVLNRKDRQPEAVGAAVAEVSIMDIMCEPSGITRTADGALLVTDTYGKQIWIGRAHV